MAPTVLEVTSVSKSFGGSRPLETLRDVSLHVEAGEFVSIVGPSGCGKSTLFNLIAGVEDLSAGGIAVKGSSDPDDRRLSTGYMFQKDLLFPWRNVVDNAALGLEVSGACSRNIGCSSHEGKLRSGRRGQPGRPPRGCRPRNRFVAGVTRPARRA